MTTRSAAGGKRTIKIPRSNGKYLSQILFQGHRNSYNENMFKCFQQSDHISSERRKLSAKPEFYYSELETHFHLFVTWIDKFNQNLYYWKIILVAVFYWNLSKSYCNV